MEIPRLLDGRLKVRHLILVDALTEQGSVIGAAATLHVTQPVVTRGLQDLEEILGVSLFDRGHRGITPTVFGTAFTSHARAVLAQLNQAARHVSEIAAAERGTIVVGTHLAGSNVLLPRAIAMLKAERPFVTVIVREATPETLATDLAAGRVDMIVGRLTTPSTDGTVRHRLYEESVRIVVGAHHPLAESEDVTLADLLEFPWILPGTETALRRELEEFFVRHEVPIPLNRIEATSFLTVRHLLIETDVVAVLPSLIGDDEERVVTLPVSLEPIGHSVGMTLASDRRLSPAARAMVDYLQDAAKAMRAAAEPE